MKWIKLRYKHKFKKDNANEFFTSLAKQLAKACGTQAETPPPRPYKKAFTCCKQGCSELDI
jgi:hypothetical protein